ncbi:MAG: PKD domain-containing protein [Sphingobacteriales bacterium]|nr:MAG: PKD domain-containing protein [Sphingobacteriales bacterium]
MAVINRLLFILFVLLLPAAAYAQAPVANFTASPTEGCVPLAVQFNASTSTGTSISYGWSIPGAGTIATTNATPSVIFTTPGTKTVTLTVSNSAGSSSKTITVTVHDTPSVNFTASPTTGCNPLTVQFTDGTNPHATGTSTYSWAFGDGSPFDNAKNPSHIYTATGCKNVTLQVTNSNNCSQSKTKSNLVCINPSPDVTFTASTQTFCRVGGTTTFTSTVTSGTAPFTYDWDFGDATTHGTTANPTHNYTGISPKTYTVTLTVTDANGCAKTYTQSNFIVIKDVTASFTGGANACVGNAVTVTNTSTPSFTGSNWDFGGLGTSTGNPSSSFTFQTSGSYTITLVTNDGPCKDTAYKSVTIYPQPTLDFTASPTDPCPAPVTVPFTATGTATTFAWDFHPGSATGKTPNNTYAANGFYDVTLIGTDANGCKDTVHKTDYVKVRDIIPVILPDKDGGCIPVTITFDSKLYTSIPAPAPPSLWVYPFSIVSYDWDFGDLTTHSTAATPSHTYTTVGVFNVVLTGVTANGCTFKDTFEIQTGTPAVPSFTVNPNPTCIHTIVNFNSTSTGTITDYLWNFGDGLTSILGPNTSHAYDTTGAFDVILTVINKRCPATLKKPLYELVNGPWARYRTVIDCANPKKVEFEYRAKDYTGVTIFFGDATSDNTNHLAGDKIIHNYASLGTYNTMMVTYNTTTGCTDTFRQTLKLIDPKAQIVADDTTICRYGKAKFTGSLSGGSIPQKLSWWFDGVYYGDSLFNYTYQFNTAGYHTVMVIAVDELGCRDTLNKTNWVLASDPVANFSATPTSGCTPLNVTFNDQSSYTAGTTFTSRTWIFQGNGNAVAGPSPITKTYGTSGAYDVTLIVTDSHGCLDTVVKDDYIEVWKPVASFGVDDNRGCIGQGLKFQCNTNDASSAYWEYGDGKTGTGLKPVHAYDAIGTYSVTMVVTDVHGCKDTVTYTDFVVISKPKAQFSLSDTFSVCSPKQVIATNTSTGTAGPITYLWDMGNGNNSSTVKNPNEVYGSGYYPVTLIVKDTAGCSDTAYSHVNILGYSGVFNYTPLLGCNPLDVTFTANLSNVPSIVWDFSDGSTQITTGQTNITHTYTTPGAYFPKIILSDGAGCSNGSDGKDTIKVDGVKPNFTNTPACIGSVVTFKDNSSAYFSGISDWLWRFDNGTTNTFNEVDMPYTKVGTYKVTLIATNGNGCKDSITKEITVNPLPTVTANADTIICLGDAAQLLGSGGTTYIWSPATGLSCTNCANPLASPPAQMEYTVVGIDDNKCSDTDQVIVSIKTKTDSEVDSGGEICHGQAMKLRARGAQSYEWFPSAGLTDNKSPEPIAGPDNTTNYVVVAYEGSCIPDTHTVRVVVFPVPDITATGAATIIAGGSTPLNSSGTLIDRFLWAPAGSLSCDDCANPTAVPTRTTEYTVTAFTDKNCQDSDKVTVTVLCDKSQLFIPNTFTPNGDGHNDVFYPRGVGLDMVQAFRVYNRWGQIVYERNKFSLNDKTMGWDGTYQGQQLPPDVFVYVVEAICDNGDVIQWKGDISLVR